MSKIKLPVSWEVSGFIEVEADSIEEAMDYFYENSDFIPLPTKSEYVDGSFALACSDLEYIKSYQKNRSTLMNISNNKT